MYSYKTSGVCSTEILFDIIDNRIYNVKFIDGCQGNLMGISRLVEGMEINEVIRRLRGVECSGSSSCPNELATALEQFLKGK